MNTATEKIDYYKIVQMSHMDILREGYRFPMSIPELIDRRIEVHHKSNQDMEESWFGNKISSFDAVFYNDKRDIKIVPAEEYLECAWIVGIGNGESNFTFDYFDSEIIPEKEVTKYLDRQIGFSEAKYDCPIWKHFLRYAPLTFEGRADDYLHLLSEFNDHQSHGYYDIDMLKINFPKKYLSKIKNDDFLGFLTLNALKEGGGLEIVTDLETKGNFAFSFKESDVTDMTPSIDDVLEVLNRFEVKKDIDKIKSELEEKFLFAGIKFNPVRFKRNPSYHEPLEDFFGFEIESRDSYWDYD